MAPSTDDVFTPVLFPARLPCLSLTPFKSVMVLVLRLLSIDGAGFTVTAPAGGLKVTKRTKLVAHTHTMHKALGVIEQVNK